MRDPGDYASRVHVRKDKTNARRVAYLTILLFASPPDGQVFTAGVVLVIAGVMLHGWAAGYLARAGYAEREKILTVRGPYRHNRNPYYLAQMTMDLGFFFLSGRPLLYVFYFPVIFFIYRRWVVQEEAFLESEFGAQYLAFKNAVPRWRFRIKPWAGRGSELNFKWATFKLNHELPRSVSHLIFLAVFASLFFFGNPLSQVSALSKITVIAAIAVWLVLQNVYPLDASQKSLGWLTFALCVAAGAILFLIYAPVWQPWSGMAAWIAIAAALCLGLLFWAGMSPDRSGSPGKSRSWFTRPICHWYVLTLALGMMSCTLGGVWLGIVVPFTVWALQFTNYLSIPAVPRRADFGLAVTILLVSIGSLTVARELTWMVD